MVTPSAAPERMSATRSVPPLYPLLEKGSTPKPA
jgi:hypothetical protein